MSSQQKILLVDDEEHLRLTVSDFLTFQGYAVELARSGEEALKKLDSASPDLIILDISMPGIGGMGFLQRLSRTAGEAPPVLVLTARANLQGFFDGLDVAGFVAKPCDKNTLLAQIRGILGEQIPEREAAGAGDTVHVLLGEDDPDMFDVLERLFTRHGYRITQADSCPGVLEAAAADRPDVVILKQFLTQLNGSAAATLLRTMPSTKGLPIVLYDVVSTGALSTASSGETTAPVDKYVEALEPSEILAAMEQVIGAA
ncbi:MAG: response regulator transcription factor [Kiritimatiellia bacterium]|nr:response regulator transcription factor [Pseudomonadales bacterium]MDP7022666.1 response regulator transcription factor [Kiritimatiellia bacterium]